MRRFFVLAFVLDTFAGVFGLIGMAHAEAPTSDAPRVTMEVTSMEYFLGSDERCHALRPIAEHDWYYEGEVDAIFCATEG